MPASISDELRRQLMEARRSEPQLAIPVVVTVAAGTDLRILERNGLKIDHAFDNISAVSGTVAAAAVDPLSGLDQVQEIEYDSTARALR